MPTAKRLGCEAELADVERVLAVGASYQRQRAVAAAHDGDLQPVVDSLLAEMRDGLPHRPAAGRTVPGPAECAEGTRHDSGRREARRRGRRTGSPATTPSWSPSAGTCTRTPSWPSPSSRPPSFLEQRLRAAGLAPRRLPTGTGLVCDVGSGDPVVVLRADIDALPLRRPQGRALRLHPRGPLPRLRARRAHDRRARRRAVALATLDGLPGTVRLVFQPAEEAIPGGASRSSPPACWRAPRRAFALHCDPSVPVGTIGLRTGAITAACDRIDVTLTGPGGHTARPQLTVDLVDALGRLITDLPGAALPAGRPPRRACRWCGARSTPASRPTRSRSAARCAARVRVLDRDAWKDAEDLMRSLVERVAATTGAGCDVDYVRGLPPVVNDPRAVALMRAAALETVGSDHVVLTPQSMGGEDFGWFAEVLPIALARLGTHGGGPPLDLHRGTFDVDERAIGIGVRLMARTALHALEADAAAPRGSAPARTGAGAGDTLPDEPSTRGGNPTMSSTDQQADAPERGADAEVPAEHEVPDELALAGEFARPPATSGATWWPACCARPAARTCPTRSRTRCARHRRHRRVASRRCTPPRTPATCRRRSACPGLRAVRARRPRRARDPGAACPAAGTSGSGTPTPTSRVTKEAIAADLENGVTSLWLVARRGRDPGRRRSATCSPTSCSTWRR